MSAAVLPKHVAAVLKCQKNPLRALEIFNSVKKEDGFNHNLSTYKCMVEKLGCYGEFNEMEGVIEEARQKIDNKLLEGVYITAIRSYGKKGKVQEAVDVFEKMEFFNCQPSVHSYNTIMNVLVEHGFFKQSHKVYMRMLEKGISPDVYTFTIRIKSFCRTNRPHVALRLLNNMPDQGCRFNAVAYCTVVGGFYEVNCRVEACELFDEMLRLGITPDVTTFNKLICMLCKKGDVQESERLLNKIMKRGVFPNLFTCNVLMQGLSERGQLNEAARMLETLNKEGLNADVVTYNTLICGLCKHSKVAEAESYLHKMVNGGFEPDAFTYNTIIGAYCKLGMIQKADRILNNAVFKGFVPDEFTFCSLIYGLCQDGDFNRAKSLFNEAAGKGMKCNVILYNTLIKGMCQQGLILEALKLMTEMPEKGCRPDTWTYNLIINGLCKMGCVSDASNILNFAVAKGTLPDIFTFNTLIDGYCKQSKLADAIEILNTMWDHDVVPDVITYNTMLDGLCKLKTPDDVMETFKVMVEKGCVPNIITYNILIESLCKSRKFMKALDLLEDIQSKGLIPDTVTFGTLINGFCENEDLEGAYELFRRMKTQYNCTHTTATYNILISAFAKKLKMDIAEKLFLEMSECGCSPDNYTYRCMIDGFCKVDNSELGYKFLLDNMTKEFLPSKETVGRVINCLCVKNRLLEAVGIIHLMVQKAVIPDVVHTIFEADKKDVAAPKIFVEDLLKKNHITYYAYELLYDGIRDKKVLKKLSVKKTFRNLSGLISKHHLAYSACNNGLEDGG
ncbi:PREDICTED: putative pentatricopeptide repeat-containing protein At1g74580 isoform X1 [Nicotiana attenuata]|uniref:putative pentatricopeptide repeat-containing protein At1g74580 isoform X1 n=1 Tax=Nicotiana attenuata TaxID=49451 RepID=UPI00090580DB|nr:PREDICTED: putative pentatricopeptide repeat-containing protein At1g74580 isoform X1 [Nicotiana attenuata]